MLRLFLSLLFLSLILFTCIALPLDSEVDDEHPFSYRDGSGKGPSNWGKINPQWKACNNGDMQSPIDLPHSRAKLFPNLGKLQRDYKSAPAVIKNRGHDLAVFWNGNAGKIRINGTDYKLIQGHWHSPSEHTFNDSRYVLEFHAVHQSSEGKTAVISIVYKYGRPDRLLSRLFNRLNTLDEEEKDIGILNPGDIKFGSRKYYRYIGSLTTPPCTEGVIWTIVKKVRTVSREQVQRLRDAVDDGYEANARPTQSTKGRWVYYYRPSDG